MLLILLIKFVRSLRRQQLCRVAYSVFNVPVVRRFAERRLSRLVEVVELVKPLRIGFPTLRRFHPICRRRRSLQRIFASNEQRLGDLLGVEFVVAIRRHDAKKFTTIGADKTNPVGRLERLPGTPLVPYGGGYLVRYPLVDAESHNAVDGKAAPPMEGTFLHGIGWYTKPPNVPWEVQMGV